MYNHQIVKITIIIVIIIIILIIITHKETKTQEVESSFPNSPSALRDRRKLNLGILILSLFSPSTQIYFFLPEYLHPGKILI